MTPQPKIDSFRFDSMVVRPKEQLWGADAIANVLECSVHSVYRWTGKPGIPIRRKGGRYFALRSELEAWLREDC